MNVLIVDMTHGGVSIACQFLKKEDYNVFALDIYNTLTPQKKAFLLKEGIQLVGEEFLDKKDEFLIIAPVHCNIHHDTHMTHHEAVKLLLEARINVPLIEVTGVKGKTSVVWMLKEIFKGLNPLILSSLGIEAIKNDKSTFLKRDISITPASILDALEIAKDYHPGIYIFETSLGGTGLADVGVLTNIAEDYPIASQKKRASHAKSQIFKSKLTVCDFDAFNRYYSHINANINTFGLSNSASLSASQINYNLDKTSFKVRARDLKTRNGEILNTSFMIHTFAPAEHHIMNALCAICASLTLNAPIKQIIEGLKHFNGIEGRTSIKKYKDIPVIEEINPGINVTAIKKSIDMIKNSEAPAVIFGGKYGVTCEEIDEETAAKFFNTLDEDIKLILVDELGKNMQSRIKRKYKYTHLDNAIEEAVKMNSKIILLIYRSNFSDISKR